MFPSLGFSNPRFMSFELEMLTRNLCKRTTISPEELSIISSKFQRQEVAKNQFLLKGGRTCKAIYYVYRGCCKSYIFDSLGKKRVIMFAFADWWITDIDSFTNGHQSKINIQSTVGSILYKLTKENFNELISGFPSFETAFRNMMQFSYIREQRRSLELITDDAPTRYLNLTNRYPNIEQDASQKDIASYLGITPEFLSALKKKLLKEGRS